MVPRSDGSSGRIATLRFVADIRHPMPVWRWAVLTITRLEPISDCSTTVPYWVGKEQQLRPISESMERTRSRTTTQARLKCFHRLQSSEAWLLGLCTVPQHLGTGWLHDGAPTRWLVEGKANPSAVLIAGGAAELLPLVAATQHPAVVRRIEAFSNLTIAVCFNRIEHHATAGPQQR